MAAWLSVKMVVVQAGALEVAASSLTRSSLIWLSASRIPFISAACTVSWLLSLAVAFPLDVTAEAPTLSRSVLLPFV